MRQKRFLIYLAIQIVVILAVIVLFKIIPDVKMASTIAGGLFVALPICLGIWERKKHGCGHKSFFIGLAQFWLLFALPILGLRLLNWEASFSDLSFLGIPGPILHKYANSSYMLMMALTAWNYWKREGSTRKVE